MSSAIITYEGYNANLYIYEDRIVIEGKGFNKGIGEKTIPITSVSAVQLVPSTLLINGCISFNVLGESASTRAGIGSSYYTRASENTIIVKSRKDDAILKKIKQFVEKTKYELTSAKSTTVIQQMTSQADELKSFKELLDQGIISQEEFDAKKKQILGL